MPVTNIPSTSEHANINGLGLCALVLSVLEGGALSQYMYEHDTALADLSFLDDDTRQVSRYLCQELKQV